MATSRFPTTANSPLETKGDLFTYSTGSAKLAVGNNGESLVADSAATTGLRYSATPSASNPVLNSAYQVWQRGTSVAGAGGGAYTADRWFVYAGGQITVSRQVTGDTTNLPNIQYCARVQRANASTDATAFVFGQSLESVNSIPFAGKTVTLSFYARKGANYSPTSSLLNVFLYTGTGTDQNQPTGYTGQASPISSSATLTTTWQRFTFTGTVASTATEISTQFYMVPVGTAGAADYYEVTGVQIDVGSVALPFRTYAATIQGELAACQRYYYRWTGGTVNFQSGLAVSTSAIWYFINPKVTPRVAPTSIENSGLNVYNVNSAAGYSSGTWALSQANPDGVIISYTHGSAVFTLASYGNILYGGTGTSYLAYSAEL